MVVPEHLKICPKTTIKILFHEYFNFFIVSIDQTHPMIDFISAILLYFHFDTEETINSV